MKSVISINDKITSTNIGLLLTLIIEGNAKFQVRGSKNKKIYNFFTAKIIDPQILCMDRLGVYRPQDQKPYIAPLWGTSGSKCKGLKMFNKPLSFN